MINKFIRFFPTPKDLRKWFDKNHKKEKELFVGYYKISSGKPSVTWSQSVDEALCFGWIDGVRRSIDGESYCIRFTSRNPKSNWSAINIKKVEELKTLGLMKSDGLAAFDYRKEEKSKIYSYENLAVDLDKSCEKKFKANKQTWKFFQSMAPSYQETALRWITSAKHKETRLKRLQTLITDCEAKRKIKPLNYVKK